MTIVLAAPNVGLALHFHIALLLSEELQIALDLIQLSVVALHLEVVLQVQVVRETAVLRLLHVGVRWPEVGLADVGRVLHGILE